MKKRLISAFILIAYSTILIKVMVLKDVPLIRIGPLMINFGGTHEGPANLLPFKTILPYLLGEKGLMIAGINLVGNIVLLVPIGFLVPFVYRNMTWKKSLALAVATGFAIEGMQAVLRVGIFDIDDVILNGLGVMIGYWAFMILANWVRLGKYKTIITTAIIIIATAVTILYVVYPRGHQRVNSGVGTDSIQHDRVEGEIPEIGDSQGNDPCNGTDGTGQIVSVGKNTITIKREDGTSQIITLTDHTTIRTSAGAASQSDLKIGDRVTLVIDESETAAIVLICNASSLQSAK
jgi:glycopeptide antibiotics resistance protein